MMRFGYQELLVFFVLVLPYLVATFGLVPYVASAKGRSGLRWLLLALLVTPLLALIALAAVPVRPEEREKEQPADADVIPYKWQKGAD
jgi:hypothetical protein